MTFDSKLTVLVVDDDPAITEILSDFLTAEGFNVATAVNSQQALAIWQSTVVNCVLLDVMMPGESGFDLCRQIREQSTVPILFLTAKDTDLDKMKGLGLGADDYIVKSATIVDVVNRIRSVLRK